MSKTYEDLQDKKQQELEFSEKEEFYGLLNKAIVNPDEQKELETLDVEAEYFRLKKDMVPKKNNYDRWDKVDLIKFHWDMRISDSIRLSALNKSWFDNKIDNSGRDNLPPGITGWDLDSRIY